MLFVLFSDQAISYLEFRPRRNIRSGKEGANFSSHFGPFDQTAETLLQTDVSRKNGLNGKMDGYALLERQNSLWKPI